VTAGSLNAARDAGGSRIRAATDLAITTAGGTLVNVGALAVTERYAGPITALCVLGIIAWRMRRRGMRWSDLGFSRPDRARRLWLQVPLALVVTLAVGGLANVGIARIVEPHDTAARFGHLAGNLPLTLWWIAVGWAIGGFAEETIFRGWLLNRFEALFGGSRAATSTAVVMQAALFGAVHAYNRGLHGFLTIGAVGLALGLLFLGFRRSLVPLVLAHGIMDMLGFLEDYLG